MTDDVKPKLLSPEQMVMWRQKHHAETPNLNADNRKRFNRKIRRALEEMSPADLAKTQAAMQAEWDGLSDDKKAKFADRIAAKAKKTADKLAGDDDDD